MKIGLIARCETARGIAIQSKNFYDHMPVERVLLVRMPRPDCTEAPHWYPGATHVPYDIVRHELPEVTVRGWLEGLDVVFTVETPNDWRIPLWCREMGVKLVIQGNPEFVRHMNDPNLPHPDEWWWPTSWRFDSLPPGRLMPVPMDRWVASPPEDDGKLHLVHVVGRRAFADRNGTDQLAQIIRSVRARVVLSVYGLDEQLPEFRRLPNVEYRLFPAGVDEGWKMYEGQHALVLPRRYGGLCLPALEAGSGGLVVVMPDCPPNQELAAVRGPVHRFRPINLACGPARCADVQPVNFAEEINTLATPDVYHAAAVAQRLLVNTWEDWKPRYYSALEALL